MRDRHLLKLLPRPSDRRQKTRVAPRNLYSSQCPLRNDAPCEQLFDRPFYWLCCDTWDQADNEAQRHEYQQRLTIGPPAIPHDRWRASDTRHRGTQLHHTHLD